ncbi:MAG: hypothetical protein ACI4MH_00745, partial [Candidatus Coproplasma sp.]
SELKLLDGHILTAQTEGSQTDAGSGVNSIVEGSVKITGSNGEDVTGYYEISFGDGTLTVTPRPIVIETSSNSWVYDGEAHSDGTHGVAEGEYGLVVGHSTRTVELTQITDVGTAENVLTVAVYDGETEVTQNYTITYRNGTLEITPRPVLIKTYDCEWVYDGTAHSYGGHGEVADGYLTLGVSAENYGLLAGHYTESYDLAQITDCGTTENILSVRVYGTSGDVTANYEISYDYGTLKITARNVIIVSEDYMWYYDGTAHSYGGNHVDTYGYEELGISVDDYGLVSGQYTRSYDLAEITEIGTLDNTLKVRIYDINGIETTQNYTVSYKYGALNVSPRPITVTAGSSTKVYDGTALTCGDYFVSSELKLLDGHILTAQTEGSQTDAGSGVNSIVEGSVKITGSNGEDVTGYYEISFGDGTLTVTPRPIVIETSSNSWVYDGEEHSDGTYAIVLDGYIQLDISSDDYGLLDGHSTVLDDFTKVINAGSYDNQITVKVYDSSSEDITSNYKVVCNSGTLQITPRPITVIAESNSWVYDGTAHSEKTHSVEEYAYGLVEGHKTVVETLTYITDVGSVENVISVRIFDLSDNDLTDNYSISYDYGTLEITPRPIKILSYDCEWEYDGTAHSCGDHEVMAEGYIDLGVDEQDYGLATGHTTQSYNLAEITIVGTTANSLQVRVYDGTTEVTGNYEITYKYGRLKVTARTIIVTAGSSTKIYDGTALTCGQILVDRLVEGHKAQAVTSGSQTDVGSSANTVIKSSIVITDANDNDVSRYYTVVSCEEGVLTVTPRPIVIETSDNSWVYDGEEHSDGTYAIVLDGYIQLDISSDDYGLLNGHSTVLDSFTKVTDAGSYDNRITVKVYDSSSEDITSNYKVVCNSGTLEITPRPVVIKTYDCEWVYDGTAHSYGGHGEVADGYLTLGVSAENYGLLAGHYTESYDLAQITDCGTTENILSVRVYGTSGDVTANYEISYDYGTLEITPRPIKILSY